MAQTGSGPIAQGSIVHVLGSLTAGGAERLVVELLPEMVRAGHTAALVCLSRQRDALSPRMLAKLEASQIPVFEGPTARVRLRDVLAYRSALRSLRPRIVHLHNLNTEAAHFLVHRFLGEAAYLGIRTIHNTELRIGPLTALALRWNPIAGTIFCSEAARKHNASRVRGSHVTIPNGVAFEAPPRDARRALAAQQELSLDPDACHFVCVGRFSGETPQSAPKAHDTLIRAWRHGELGKQHAQLHLLGDGVLRPQLESLAAGDPSIHLHGVVGDVPRWLVAADCFVMPSRWEGMPMAAVEAIGAGLPCIFSRIPPLVELDPPAVGWCEPGDVASLAEALRAFRLHPQLPTAAAVESRRERFDVRLTARRYLEFYSSLEP